MVYSYKHRIGLIIKVIVSPYADMTPIQTITSTTVIPIIHIVVVT